MKHREEEGEVFDARLRADNPESKEDTPPSPPVMHEGTVNIDMGKADDSPLPADIKGATLKLAREQMDRLLSKYGKDERWRKYVSEDGTPDQNGIIEGLKGEDIGLTCSLVSYSVLFNMVNGLVEIKDWEADYRTLKKGYVILGVEADGEDMPGELQTQQISRYPIIANALSGAMSEKRMENGDLFALLDEEMVKSLKMSDRVFSVERKGKPVSLTVEEMKLVRALSAYIDYQSDGMIQAVKEIDRAAKEGVGNVPKPSLRVSIQDLSRTIRGAARETDIRSTGETLLSLGEKEQILRIHTKSGDYKFARPLVLIRGKIWKEFSEIRTGRGRKAKGDIDEEPLLIAAEVELSHIFLYEAKAKYCRFFPERFFPIARRHRDKLFHTLFDVLQNSYRRKCYIPYMKDRKENGGKSVSYIYKISLASLRDRIPTDYTSTRKMQLKFFTDLERAIPDLVEYGIITGETRLSREEGFLYVHYNPLFSEGKELIPDTKDIEEKEG